MEPEEFGKYMRSLREKAGFSTMEELAKMSGVSAPTILRIETGKTKEPEIGTLTKLAKPLNVSQFELLSRSRFLPHQPKSVLTLKTLIKFLKDPENLKQLNPQILTEMQTYISAVLDFADQSPLTSREFQQLEQYKSFIIAKRETKNEKTTK
jgi:transcriptional regulator with XRE-family HTH domain